MQIPHDLQINCVATINIFWRPASAPPPPENDLLLETSGNILLETSGNLLLEN